MQHDPSFEPTSDPVAGIDVSKKTLDVFIDPLHDRFSIDNSDPAIAALARKLGTTPPQLIFCFSRAVGILPLTGSANAEHLQQDLASVHLALPPEVIAAIESIAG